MEDNKYAFLFDRRLDSVARAPYLYADVRSVALHLVEFDCALILPEATFSHQ